MNDRLSALRPFARVARKGSFSAAARERGVPQSTASRTIAALERDIGAALLVRTTRAVTLTDAGSDFLARIEPILAALDEAEHAARGTGELRGMLRVAMGSSLAVREVIPRLPPFMDKHPNLQMDLIMEDQRQDLVTEGVDVALRFGSLADSTATAKRIRAWPRVVVASPVYLAKAGTPEIPADLTRHTVIVGPQRAGTAWSFQRGGAASSIQVEGRLAVRVNEGAVAAAAAGLGIVMTTSGGCQSEVASGALVRVLEDWDAGTVDLSAVFASGRAAKPAARAFADYLIGALRDA